MYTLEKEEYILSEINQILDEYHVTPQNEECYLSSSVVGMLADGRFIANPETVNAANAETMENVAQVYLVSLHEYNECMGTNETLKDGEVLIYCIRRSYDDPEKGMRMKVVSLSCRKWE